MGQTRTKIIDAAIEEPKLKKIEEIEKTLPNDKQGRVTTEPGKAKKAGKPKTRSNRYKQSVDLIDKSKLHPLDTAIDLIQKTTTTKFDSSIEAHINLSLSSEKSDHQIRTTTSLPHQTGKKIKLLVFSSKNHEELKKLGAQLGTEKILKEIEAGKIFFDKIIADPSWMPRLAKVARVLGPKGLMPNPKSGTVSEDTVAAAKEFSAGKMELRTEKFPIVHVIVGKSSFKPNQIEENLKAVVAAIRTARPEGFKKELIKSVYLSSTMGPSVKVDPSSLKS
ncbi:MAG: 50S ribosomal protein L1 [bacterium]|nr:50S ribosomal protein L1 [bacterium]